MAEVPVKAIQVPSDLGFDNLKFPQYRLNQLEVAQQAAASEKALFLLEAPTGAGKSLAGLSAAKIKEAKRAVYLVATKQLQDQVENDFHIPVLKGRANYPCLHFLKNFPDITSEICSEFKSSQEGCTFQNDCPYSQAKKAALSAPVCILNYPLFLSEANFVGGFSGVDFAILDEVDTLEDQLMSFIEVSISKRIMERYKLGLPKFRTKLEAWKEWAEKSSRVIKEDLDKVKDPGSLYPLQLKEYVRTKRSYRKIDFLASALDEGWVMELEEDPKSLVPVTFKPVVIGPFAKSSLWKHTSSSLGMSATIMGAAAMSIDLGLHSWDAEFASIPSPFPIESRMVMYCPVANVTHKTKGEAYPKLVQAVEKILKRHPTTKVLLHAVSYDLANYFRDNLHTSSHNVMSHGRINRATTLEAFKQMQQPTVLISPSMERGVDLPGDLCRIVICAKVPFPNLASPQVNKRLHGYSDGNLWYARRTARALEQMTGRATRYLGDWSISYILDEQFGHIVARNGAIFSEWWKAAVKYLDPHEL